MSTLQLILRRARTLVWTALSILIILAAILMGLGELLMPYSDRYQPRLEAWLSQEFGQPVVLEGFQGEWTAFGPRLTLKGMKLLPAEAADGAVPEVMIESAALDIRPFSALLPGFPLYNFRVVGADFELLRAADGQLRLSGFGVSQRGGAGQGSALAELARVGEVVLQDSSLAYRDEIAGVQLEFRGIEGRLQLEGEQLASEITAQLFERRSDLVYGDIEATVLLTLDADRKLSGATWQATLGETMLAALQGRLPESPFLPLTGWLNAELWGHWSRADGHQVRGVADLQQGRLVGAFRDLWLERFNARFQWRHGGRGNWSLHIADLLFDDGAQAWTAPRLAVARDVPEGLGLWIGADRLPVGVPLNLARDIMSIYGTAWPEALPREVRGVVHDFDLVLDPAWQVEWARARLDGLQVDPWNRWPGIDGLSGKLVLSRGAGHVALQADALAVDWPGMFRETFELAVPTCGLDIGWGERWQVTVSDCGVRNDDLALQGTAVITGNGGRPALDLNVVATQGRIGQLDPYWPEPVMSETAKAWLRRGLVAGTLEHARTQIRGDLDDWPFRRGEGRFEVVARVKEGQVDFLEGWPDARGVDVVARFEGASMDIRGAVADSGGLSAPDVRVGIPDFARPVLTVDYAGRSDLPSLLRYLRQTPLQAFLQDELDRFEFAGPAAVSGRVVAPLGSTAGELEVDGTVTLADGAFAAPDLDLLIEAIGGRVHYDQRGFDGSGLGATWRGQPARLDVVADADSPEKFRASLAGRFTLSEVAPAFLQEHLGLLGDSGDAADWRCSVAITQAPDGVTAAQLELDSDLRGLALSLPAPLDKAAQDTWPLRLTYPLSGDDRLLRVAIEDRLALTLDLPGGAAVPRGVVLRLGGGRPSLPVQGRLGIEGGAGLLDLDGWIDLVVDQAQQGGGLAGLTLAPGLVSAQQMRFLDRLFNGVNLQIEMLDGGVQAGFDAADIDGSVRLVTGAGGQRSLSAEFDRLALGEPVATGVEVDTNPAELPALHLYARSLRWSGVELGETRIEAYPTADGLHFDKIEAMSGRLSVRARGDWLRDGQGQRSDFSIHMTSESLGDFLQSLDLGSPVQGGQTMVNLTAWWPGPPAAFGLARLNGEVEFSVVNGNITSANAGGGRLLGLLSVQALPRRLALDFRDVFDTGYAFDEASGSFTLENGRASTDDVLLRSSAATISVSGSTDLVAREYDQLLTIRPGVGNTLPIIGALAAGPGGAAAGLALQGLLHSQLAEATRVQYAVTGNWDDPQIEPVGVDRKDG
jgi:uncharacterized protein (TIGR02099 family)